MKVYIVTSYFGEYEDSYQRIIGIYENPIDAENIKSSIIETNKIILDKGWPNDSNIDDMTPDEVEVWSKEWNDYNDAEEFNFCDIKEYDTIPSKQ